MTLRTRLTEKLGITHPVLLAPMGSISGGRLAGAVSEAGGLGLIGGGYGNADWLEREFAAAGNRRVGCGFITWSLAKQPDLLEVALARNPAALMLSFGDPRPFAKRIHAAGAVLICQVQSRDHALQALEAGAEIIVAQGTEAGGHGGSRATLPFVPAIVDLVAERAPEAIVVAAGGIADGRGLAAALAMGAEGVLLGTRFLATHESPLHANFKQAIVDSDGHDTVLTEIPDLAGQRVWPGAMSRAKRNRFIERWAGREWAIRQDVAEIGKQLAQARAAGDINNASLSYGEDAGLIDSIKSVKQVIEDILAEAEEIIKGRLQTVLR